jgi:hypothetical protein
MDRSGSGCVLAPCGRYPDVGVLRPVSQARPPRRPQFGYERAVNADQLLVAGHVLVAGDRGEHAVSDGDGHIGPGGQQLTDVDAFRIPAFVCPEALIAAVWLGKSRRLPVGAELGERIVEPLLEHGLEVPVCPALHEAIMPQRPLTNSASTVRQHHNNGYGR